MQITLVDLQSPNYLTIEDAINYSGSFTHLPWQNGSVTEINAFYFVIQENEKYDVSIPNPISFRTNAISFGSNPDTFQPMVCQILPTVSLLNNGEM